MDHWDLRSLDVGHWELRDGDFGLDLRGCYLGNLRNLRGGNLGHGKLRSLDLGDRKLGARY